MLNPQLDRRGEPIHLLTTEGLPRRHVERLLDMALAAPPAVCAQPAYLCLPDDAATERDAYSAAAASLGLRPVALAADAGETLADVAAALEPGLLVLRHAASGAAHCAAAHAAPGVRVINAGDGGHADPLPALALLQAMREARQDLANLSVTLVGDLRHSRVARSAIHAMTTLGVAQVSAAGPGTLQPEGLAQLGVRACASLREGLDADVIVILPLDVERISGALLPSAREYEHSFGLTPAILAGARADALLLPAGALTPGVEVDADVAASLAPTQARLAAFTQQLRVAALAMLAGDAP